MTNECKHTHIIVIVHAFSRAAMYGHTINGVFKTYMQEIEPKVGVWADIP